MPPTVSQMPFRTDVPALGEERPVVWPRRLRRRLANRLEVVLVESHSVPKFTAELFFRSGNSDGVPGLAEMTATVARTGTSRRGTNQIEDDLRKWGADLSTNAGADTTAIAFSGLTEFAGPLLALVAEIAREASFPNEEFDRERHQKLEELNIARTTPDFLSAERIRKVLFGPHPYANFAPTKEQVEGYTRESLLKFYGAHYQPADALLIAVGDFAPEAMLEQIEKALGSWKGAGPARAARPAPPRQHGRRVFLVHLPGAVQTDLLLGNLAITRKNPDWLRLGLANNIYGGAFHSRLVMNIREKRGYTYSPRSSVVGLREHGFFHVHAAVRNEVVAATLTEIFYELDRLRALAVEPEELENALSYMSGLFSLGLGTQEGIAAQLATAYLEELPEDYLETYRERVRALKGDDVLVAARRYFDAANAQIVVVGDRAAVAEQAGLFGDVEVYDPLGNRL